MMPETVEVIFGEENDLFSVKKDGEELMTFDREENIGDIFYGVVELLKSLGYEVKQTVE